MNEADILIVGAGMAGLTAATQLEKRGVTAILLDKGRAPGGRMATRSIGEARFDHGAQHFSARSAAFRKQTQEWIEQDIVREWFASASLTQADRPIEPRHVGVGGMRRLPERIAADLNVLTSIQVERVEWSGTEFTAVSSRGRTWSARGLILTPPAPQTLELLGRSGIHPSSDVESMLTGAEYDPCLAVMARLEQRSGLPEGHLALNSEPIAWIADNQHKGTSAVPAVTVHSSASYAMEHLEADPDFWVDRLVEAAAPHLSGSVVDATGHRWRYSQPRRVFDVGAVAAAPGLPLVLAGELFAGARVEGAYRSGVASAELLETML
ncbi:MAG: FAD-dependent oxidoreductase [Acidimicrobiia bacterium]|nr:FAD-dependent oxidoreductase [Acidimicrobiia bacterium]